MAGRLEGVSDLEWRLCEDMFPQPHQNVDVACSLSLCA
jgi:hypothetical protein